MAINLTDIKKTAEKTVTKAVSEVTGGDGENPRDSAFKKICAFIPGKISNKAVVEAFELMRKQQQAAKKSFTQNLNKNVEAFKKHTAVLTKAGGYVEDQNNYTDMAYGESTMKYSGCEIFATYNALRRIHGKEAVTLPTLISGYEKDGMVLNGKFGTAPQAIADYFNNNGHKATVHTEESEFDAVGKEHDAMVLTMYNDKNDISKEVHTVCLTKDNGKFYAHNVYCNGKVVGPADSVTKLIGMINSGKAKGISLIGVKKK